MAGTRKQKQNPEDFRENIATVDEKGKRVWLFPTKPKGRFLNYRFLVGYGLLLGFVIIPFIKIGDQPFLMLNVLERKFVIFGQLFVPQDFHLFVLGMLSLFLFIVLFTVIYGRIWCGWTCPQTILMELVYRRIEYWIEGDAPAQRKLKNAPWNADKIRKKVLKHGIFVALSAFFAHMLMGYVVGGDELIRMVTNPPKASMSSFVAAIILTIVIYYIFAKFREQVCIAFCPYGRLQGVLLDKSSVVISYDHVRGEPRGPLKRGKKAEPAPEPEEAKGDCIDCGLCVRVCPTGIDIRNGTQLECVNCTACIDACDEIMDKVGKPRGLVRYASENEIETGQPFKFTGRIVAYTVVLALLLGVTGFFLTGRSMTETTILRAPGLTYQKTDEGHIKNLYTLQVMNKSNNDLPLQVKVLEPQGARLEIIGGDSLSVKAQGTLDGAFFVILPRENLNGLKTNLKVEVSSGNEVLEEVKTTFMGPAK